MSDNNWARRFAAAYRVKKVTLEMPNGETAEASLRVPVGLEAAEYMESLQSVFDAQSEVDGLLKSFGLTDAKTADYEALEPDELKVLTKATQRATLALSAFVVEWLPRLCDEMEGMDEPEIANILRVSGGEASPLIPALASFAGSHSRVDKASDLEELAF